MPFLGARRKGDLFVTTVVDIPRNISAKQRELLTQLAETFDEKPHDDPSFFKRAFGSK